MPRAAPRLRSDLPRLGRARHDADSHWLWGAVFLGTFLALALLVRRFVWALLLVPIATLPYVNTERRVWIVLTVVAILSTGVIAGLDLLARSRPAVQVRLLPVAFLTLATACAATLSILTSGPPVPALNLLPGLAVWPSSEVGAISCPSPTQCVAVGEQGKSSIATARELLGSTWRAETSIPRVATLQYVSCASPTSCLADDYGPVLAVERDGQWRHALPRGLPNLNTGGYARPTTACSPNGLCWVLFQRYILLSSKDRYGPSYQVTDALGERGGHWLPMQQVGPTLTPRARRHRAEVFVGAISCWSTSSCTIAGTYLSGVTGAASFRPFIQTETNGRWGAPRWVPSGLARSPKDRFNVFPLFSPLSCTAGGSCLLGGFETRGGTIFASALERYADGRWQPTVLGTGDELGGQSSQIVQVACHMLSLCVAAGGGAHGHGWLFFRTSVEGRWQRSFVVRTPGTSGFSLIAAAHLMAAVCPSMTTCYVVGWWGSFGFGRSAFAASYVDGRWSFHVFDLGRGELATTVEGVDCDAQGCWAVGTAMWAAVSRQGSPSPWPTSSD